MLWPTRAAASANNFLDHFPGSSLNARWTALTSGTGTVTVTDSYVSTASGATLGAAGLYLNTKLDKTKSQLWLACVSGQHLSGASNVLEVVNKATAPVADTQANFTLNTRIAFWHLSGASSNGIWLVYYDSTHADQRWDGVTNAWVNGFGGSLSVTPVKSDDYYILGLEIDAPGARFRMLAYGINSTGGYVFDQGPYLTAMTDWVLFSALETNTDLWLVIGSAYTDWTASREWRCEWVRYAEQGSAGPVEAWAASKNATGDNHQPRHYWSYDGLVFVPESRTGVALAPQAGGTPAGWEAGEIQAPSIAYDGVATDYLFYTGMDSSFPTVTGLGVAKAPHAIPQNGPWTRGASNPIIVTAADEDRVRYSFGFKDDLEPDPNKRWKLLFHSRVTATQKKRVNLATAPDPPDTSTWTRQGIILDVGGTGALDEGGPFDACCVVHVHGQWEVYYEALDAAGVSRVLRAYGPSLTSLTKDTTNVYAAKAANGATTLTANVTNSRTLTVASTTGFEADERINLSQQATSSDDYGVSRVRKVVNSTTLELYHALDGFTTTNPAHVRSARRIPFHEPRAYVRVGAEWWLYITTWGIFDDDTVVGLSEDEEVRIHSSARPGDAIPTIDELSYSIIPHDTLGIGRRSLENFSLFNYPVRHPPQFARPTSDVAAGTWTNQSGGTTNLYQAVDEYEPPDDTDYLQSAANPASDALTLAFEPVSDPLVSAGYILRYRISRT